MYIVYTYIFCTYICVSLKGHLILICGSNMALFAHEVSLLETPVTHSLI